MACVISALVSNSASRSCAGRATFVVSHGHDNAISHCGPEYTRKQTAALLSCHGQYQQSTQHNRVRKCMHKQLRLQVQCQCAAAPLPANIAATQDAPTLLHIDYKLSQPDSAAVPPTFVKADGRVVAIGDVHGDLHKAVQSLMLAGVMQVVDERPVWCGGNTVVVQLGDVLDRGDDEIGSLMLLRQLHQQAQQHGGAVYMLNGNHESLNVCGDFRYVTEGGFMEAARVAGLSGPVLWKDVVQARVELYAPGGRMGLELSKNPTILVVNDTLFVHGGVLPLHVQYGVQRINAEVSAWMAGVLQPDGGRTKPPFIAMGDSKSVMWNRVFGKERFGSFYDSYQACAMLTQVLESVGAKRMVVGHCPQTQGVNAKCDGRVWRVDVGMSSGVLSAPATVLQIEQPVTADAECSVQVLVAGKPASTTPAFARSYVQ